MPKELEFHFDVGEDEETWLTPQLSERSVGTQSKPVDLKEWFAQIQTSERASLLSKKLQKYAQKRATRARLCKGVSSSLDVVTERDASPEVIHSCDYKKSLNDGGISANYLETITAKSEERTSQNETDESSIANSIEGSISSISPTDVRLLPSDVRTASSPSTDSVPRIALPNLSSSPELEITEVQMPSDSDEEFFDANSDFCEGVQNLVLVSSLHEDQLNGNGMLPDDDSGISVGRNCMTQSLVKVEEEISAAPQGVQTKEGKTARATSVSPRPVSTTVSTPKSKQGDSHVLNDTRDSIEQHRNKTPAISTALSSRGNEVSQKTRLSRPMTSQRPLSTPRQSAPAPPGSIHQLVVNARVPNPKAQLLHNLISVPSETNEQPDRNRNINYTADSRISHPTSGSSPLSKTQSDIPDLAALREIARQQEEALRQAVEQQQQHGNVERKYSWHNEANLKSPYSSAGSLVSSKSADMSTLHKTNANMASKIPAPSRVPRRTGIPTPSKRAGSAVRCASVIPRPIEDDECF